MAKKKEEEPNWLVIFIGLVLIFVGAYMASLEWDILVIHVPFWVRMGFLTGLFGVILIYLGASGKIPKF